MSNLLGKVVGLALLAVLTSLFSWAAFGFVIWDWNLPDWNPAFRAGGAVTALALFVVLLLGSDSKE